MLEDVLGCVSGCRSVCVCVCVCVMECLSVGTLSVEPTGCRTDAVHHHR